MTGFTAESGSTLRLAIMGENRISMIQKANRGQAALLREAAARLVIITNELAS